MIESFGMELRSAGLGAAMAPGTRVVTISTRRQQACPRSHDQKGFALTKAAAKVDASCNQVFEAAGARARVADVRRNRLDPAQSEESCRAYANQFFEAVKARQAAAICGDGLDHQRDLELLDAGIDAVNNLIASQCSGS